MVFAVLASANRDERQFERPDELDLSREPNRHVAFGLGVHYCLGAPLARLEGQIAINTLLRRMPDLRLAVPVQSLRWRPGLVLHGMKSLPVTFDRRRCPLSPGCIELTEAVQERITACIAFDGSFARLAWLILAGPLLAGPDENDVYILKESGAHRGRGRESLRRDAPSDVSSARGSLGRTSRSRPPCWARGKGRCGS